jgi:hypothetical protein
MRYFPEYLPDHFTPTDKTWIMSEEAACAER